MCPPGSHNGNKIHNFVKGGKVKKKQINISSRFLKPRDPDRVLVRVMPGELIVPKSHVLKVEKFLKSKKIKLRGMK
jgi:hypothetical protein